MYTPATFCKQGKKLPSQSNQHRCSFWRKPGANWRKWKYLLCFSFTITNCKAERFTSRKMEPINVVSIVYPTQIWSDPSKEVSKRKLGNKYQFVHGNYLELETVLSALQLYIQCKISYRKCLSANSYNSIPKFWFDTRREGRLTWQPHGCPSNSSSPVVSSIIL